MNDNHARLSPALVETIAGLSAGTASTLAVHPLDVIKTRLQIHRSSTTTPTSSFTVLRSLLQQPQPIQSLYRGLTPNLLGNASSWALFFYFKSIIETQLRFFHARTSNSLNSVGGSFQDGFKEQTGLKDGKSTQQLSAGDYFTSSLIAGVAITLSTNPIWVLKTRMLSTNKGAEGAYPSMVSGARSVWKYEGIRGFYRGVGISMLGVSHGAVQFAVYEPLKNVWSNHVAGPSIGTQSEDGKGMSNAATLVLSGTAKIIAGTVTYPYQVVRSRLQTYDAEKRFGKGISGVVSRIWAEEGVRGFYRGVGPNVVRVLPATWVTFLVYENTRFYLPRWVQ